MKTITASVLAVGLLSLAPRATAIDDAYAKGKIPGVMMSYGPGRVTGYTDELSSHLDLTGVTHIEDHAFQDCAKLRSVKIPDSVTSIGVGAFEGCADSLYDTKTIPGVKLVDGWAVGFTDELAGRLDLTGARGVACRAFRDCHKLTSVKIPDNVKHVPADAFDDSLYDTNAIPGVKMLDGWAFALSKRSRYEADKKAEPGKSFGEEERPREPPWHLDLTGVTHVGDRAFSGCDLMTSVIIPESVISIGDEAFSGCDLTSVTIPDSVKSIGDEAFSRCRDLTSVKIGKGVKYIGRNAFSKDVYLEDDSIVDENPFYKVVSGMLLAKQGHKLIRCNNVCAAFIPDGVTSIEEGAFARCDHLICVTIPDSVTTIGEGVFAECELLTYVVIGKGVKHIGKRAFACGNRWKGGPLEFSVAEENPAYKVVSGMLLTKNGETLVRGNAIPDEVNDETDDFKKYSISASVTIPDSVINIGDWAFVGCRLTKVSIPSSITSIGDGAFAGCPLTKVSIPNSVTRIGNRAFSWCSDLTSVAIPDSVTDIGVGTFGQCRGLTGVTIPNSVTSIGASAFGGCESLTRVTIPNSVTSIGELAFGGCESLTGVTIPNSVTNIGKHAFNGCSGLTSVTIPNSVTSIKAGTFYGCESLTRVTIPNSVTNIGEYAFDFCDSLKRVSIPKEAQVGNHAFGYNVIVERR